MKDVSVVVQVADPSTGTTGDLLMSSLPVWVERALGALYNGYYRLLKAKGNAFVHQHQQTLDATPRQTLNSTLTQVELDRFATRVGAAYRGLGILIGFLGAAIILCALLPVGLTLTEVSVTTIGVLKVVLMLLLVVVLLVARKLGLKDCWVQLRRAAEYKRYETLRSAIAKAAAAPQTVAFDALCIEVNRHLGGGDECQIRYNEMKRADYVGIEAFGTRITYAGFTVSFLAAAVHLFLHVAWLIFLTAYLPALIGAMHAVNSFLRLPQLVDQHGELVQILRSLRQQLSSAGSRDEYVVLSRQLLDRLQDADENWNGIAAHQDIHPA